MYNPKNYYSTYFILNFLKKRATYIKNMLETLPSIICSVVAEIIEYESEKKDETLESRIEEIYSIEHIVLIIYKGLNTDSQYIIYRILMNKGVGILDLNEFKKEGELSEDYKLALKQLNALNLLIYFDKDKYILNESFCKNLSNFIFSNSHEKMTKSEETNLNDKKTKIDKETDVLFLREYAEKRWNSMLDFVTQNYSQELQNENAPCTSMEIFEILQFSSKLKNLL